MGGTANFELLKSLQNDAFYKEQTCESKYNVVYIYNIQNTIYTFDTADSSECASPPPPSLKIILGKLRAWTIKKIKT
jgi:hypothetical protein